MKFGIWLLKHFFPKRERERCEIREAVTYATAHAENVARELSKIDVKKLNGESDHFDGVRHLWRGKETD